jgi:hypothetical protein
MLWVGVREWGVEDWLRRYIGEPNEGDEDHRIPESFNICKLVTDTIRAVRMGVDGIRSHPGYILWHPRYPALSIVHPHPSAHNHLTLC